ncbi:rCG25950, isoform CRA_a [Rattus norvegicus]|uniref:RCG25950, isoform CRA_a n=1 Tax=Rattus norvegicus TaxID=10116 RepID=A6I4D7_RAT|nr:rCG25950, isoform CRA_a [Rattus norvegicus]
MSKSRPLTKCSMGHCRITINSKAWCAIKVPFSSCEKHSSATWAR